ncbi:MAG: helix-turn-helix domain-containing protein [Candidatus Aenigmatarchaeota archaeon]
MLPFCEVVVKKIIPAVRVRVAKQLYKKYNFSQEEIANKLNLTQAAISKYLSGKYTEEIRKLERSENVKNISEEIVKAILYKSFRKINFEKIFCGYCSKIGGYHEFRY